MHGTNVKKKINYCLVLCTMMFLLTLHSNNSHLYTCLIRADIFLFECNTSCTWWKMY